jgi:hypothetical protein
LPWDLARGMDSKKKKKKDQEEGSHRISYACTNFNIIPVEKRVEESEKI